MGHLIAATKDFVAVLGEESSPKDTHFLLFLSFFFPSPLDAKWHTK